MAQVGGTVTVAVAAVPAGASISNVALQYDATLFAPTADPMVLTCLAAASQVTISATATAVDGSTVSGVSAPFDVAALVATGLTVTVN